MEAVIKNNGKFLNHCPKKGLLLLKRGGHFVEVSTIIRL